MIDDLYDYLEPLLKKQPNNVIIHCGTNDSIKKSAGQIINELKNLKTYIQERFPLINVYFSSPSLRIDNILANKTLLDVAHYLEKNFNSVSSFNIDKTCLGKRGLHLNSKGSGRLAINLISFMKCL